MRWANTLILLQTQPSLYELMHTAEWPREFKVVYHDFTTEDCEMCREKRFLDVLSLSVQRKHEH